MAMRAAKWNTVSAPSTTSRADAGSRTSPSTTSIWSSTSPSSESNHPQEPNELYNTMARTR